jgi:hypothetical protein
MLARLGHVIGWAGNGFASLCLLAMLVGSILIATQSDDAIPDGLTTWAPPAADFPSVMQHPMATDPAIAALPPGYTIEPASARPTGIPPPPGFVIQPAKPDRAPVAAPDELSWDAVMTPSQSQSTPKSRPLRLARFAVLFPLAVVAFLSFLAGRAGRYILAGPG